MKKLTLFFILISNFTYSQVSDHSLPDAKKNGLNRPQHDPPEIINAYTEVLLLDECNNSIKVQNDSAFNIGDTVLLIQMKGALIDTSNTAAFGTIIDYKSAGNYEFNYISQKAGNILTFKNKLTRTYEIPDGVVQLVRVPYANNRSFGGGITCQPWDGGKGGILAVIAKSGLNSYDIIDVGGRGFRGGEGYNAVLNPNNCFENNYNYPAGSQLAGFKGESITAISQNIIKGKGSPAAGGGGGLSHNSGGGGGANAGSGGFGGYQSDTCGNAPFDNRGVGGKNLLYSNSINKIFMGSGGGGGHADNTGLNFPQPKGGSGGGIIIIITDSLAIYNHRIYANGNDGEYCYSPDCNDGMGGGGGGGTVLLKTDIPFENLNIQANGGNGANMLGSITVAGKPGPGGGGGGGTVFFNSGSLPLNATINISAGAKGIIAGTSGNAWGATAGTNGQFFFNHVISFDTVLFKRNIDSVRITDSIINCSKEDLKGFAFTNTFPIISWYWDLGDGATNNTQNVLHSYGAVGTYSVKLIATDTKGCKDSIIKPVIITDYLFADAGNDTSVCSSGQILLMLNGNGIGTYSWSPAAYLNNSNIQNPVATINATGTTNKFYLTVSNGTGCSAIDSVIITVNPKPILNASKSNDINCKIPFAHLSATGALQYAWTPANFLNNASIAAPVANPTGSTTFVVTGIGQNGCINKDSVYLAVDFGNKGFDLPNSFTPNGDGMNDCFGIRYYRDVQNLVFIIYNRFGEKVFETNNAGICWDGNDKGQPADAGNYIYYINARTLCGDVVKKGNILLLR